MKNKLTSLRSARGLWRGLLFLTGVALAATGWAAASSGKATVPTAKDLAGLWVHVGEPGKIEAAPEKGGFTKHRTDRHWVAVNVDGRSSLVTSTHGGSWQLKGDEYEETVDYGGGYQAPFMGKTYRWKVKLEGDLMIKTGLNNEWHEVWKRVK